MDFEKWKKAYASWLKTGPQEKILKLTKTEVSTDGYGSRRRNISIPHHVFSDAPQPPERPTDRVIRDVMKTLKFIAFTAPTTVSVTSSQLEEWFPTESEEDDE